MVQLPYLRASLPQKRYHLFRVPPTGWRHTYHRRIAARLSIESVARLTLIDSTTIDPGHMCRRIDLPLGWTLLQLFYQARKRS